MKRKRAGSLIIVAILAAIIVAALHQGPAPADKAPGADVLPESDILGIARPQRRDFAETCHWFGKVESRKKDRVIAMETGRIAAIAAGDGMLVAEGTRLFIIGGPLIDSRLDALCEKTSALNERVELAEETVNIKRKALSQHFARHDELASAEDRLARLKAEMECASQELLRLREASCVRATVGGVFTNRRVSAGQEVQMGDELAEIISRDDVYIAATLFPGEGDLELEEKRMVIDLPTGKSTEGTVISVLPERTAEGATVVWIEGHDLASTLRPGETVSGTAVLSVHERALAIPQDAVVQDEEGRSFVFIKDSTGYRRQRVKTGIVSDGWVEIMSGVGEGDEIVVRGAYELFYRDFNKVYRVAD